MSEPKTQLLLEHYKLRVAWATAHYDRIMRRLQLFLTLETAVATAGILSSNHKLSPAAPWIAGLETLLSLAWLSVGRSDRRMLKIYNHQLTDNWTTLAGLASVSGETPIGSVSSITVDPRVGLEVLLEAKSVKDVPYGSALIPLVLVPCWLIATVVLALI
jgi:hypothetical protein